MSAPLTHIVFDLDGTLLNTLDDLADAGNHVCSLMGWPTFSHDAYRFKVGNGIHKLIERIVPAEFAGDAPIMQRALDEFRSYYAAHKEDHTAPYPGIAEMLDEMRAIQASRFSAAGYGREDVSRLVQPVRYEENLPYNRAFSYNIFFLSAVLLLVIQQTMFYGMSMLTGTMREEKRSISVLPVSLKGRGLSRTVAGRGAAYWLIYMAIGVYVAVLVPKMFGLPQNCGFPEIFVLLLFYVSACVVFSLTFSALIRRRETVFVLFLFMSPVCLFLTGFSWPESSFPGFWKAFSYLFPSTFAVRAFINMNTAGAGLTMASPQLVALTVQIIVYYILSCLIVFAENRLKSWRPSGLLR